MTVVVAVLNSGRDSCYLGVCLSDVVVGGGGCGCVLVEERT